MRNPIVLKSIGSENEAATGGLLQRAFRRFRLPLRETSNFERTAARDRAQRIFEVNFRSPWTR